MAEERLQKILSRAGIASRRAAEELIVAGLVVVNGRRADKLGTRADPDRDEIRVRGKLVGPRSLAPRRYFLAFKPRQMVTTMSDPEGRPCIADLLRARGVRPGVFPVGRLDWDADGLLLLTDDGDLANAVMHPRGRLAKVYTVKVKGVPSDRELDKVRRGVLLEPGVRALPAEVVVDRLDDDVAWLTVTITEGRKNQIKKMFERVGHPVRRIRRMAIGPLRIGKMRPGELRELTVEDLRRLRAAVAAGANADTAPLKPPARRSPAGARPAGRGERRGGGASGPRTRPAGRRAARKPSRTGPGRGGRR